MVERMLAPYERLAAARIERERIGIGHRFVGGPVNGPLVYGPCTLLEESGIVEEKARRYARNLLS